MNRILDRSSRTSARFLEPGVVNLDITLAVERQGYFYAPDPSSQRACTIGGNVAENAGGPHTLAYGVTTNHVLGWRRAAGRHVVSHWRQGTDLPGYDLTGLLTGSEGTMALVTKIMVRLMRKPEMVKTILAIYDARVTMPRIAVAEITARAITPVAVEMLDGVMLRMVEEATHAGYPMDAAAVLLIELEGLREAVEEQVEQIRESCQKCRRARGSRGPHAESASCCGRAARTRSARWAASARRITCRMAWCRARRSRPRCAHRRSRQQVGLTISNIFHAGDGNMHPIILFDAPQAGRTGESQGGRRGDPAMVHRVGGSITGEHGVGMEKIVPGEVVERRLTFSNDDLAKEPLLWVQADPDQIVVSVISPDGHVYSGASPDDSAAVVIHFADRKSSSQDELGLGQVLDTDATLVGLKKNAPAGVYKIRLERRELSSVTEVTVHQTTSDGLAQEILAKVQKSAAESIASLYAAPKQLAKIDAAGHAKLIFTGAWQKDDIILIGATADRAWTAAMGLPDGATVTEANAKASGCEWRWSDSDQSMLNPLPEVQGKCSRLLVLNACRRVLLRSTPRLATRKRVGSLLPWFFGPAISAPSGRRMSRPRVKPSLCGPGPKVRAVLS
jgi:FAD/FMN-containing dehydrogenase